MNDSFKEDISVHLIITHKCNLQCIYCYETRKTDKAMRIETAKEILAEYLNNSKKFSFVNIVLFGGEPFLYFQIVREICEWVWSNEWEVKYIFNFSTNGTLLNNESKEWLKENSNRILLTLSADGMKESQDINRDNSFDKIDFNFFVNTWNPPFVKMTISEKTLYRLAEDVIFFHKMGFVFTECNLAVGIAWDKEENVKILEKELAKLIDFYLENPEVEPAPILKLDLWKCETSRKKEKSCGMGTTVFSYDCDGLCYPCNFATPMSFNKKDIKQLMRIDYNKIDLLVDDECYKNCYLFPVCPTCYAGDFQSTGMLKRKNRAMCRLVKIRAIYAAKLRAEKLKREWKEISDDAIEKKIRMQLEIKAIRYILNRYEIN